MRIYKRIEQRVALAGDSETRRSQKALSTILLFAGGILTMINYEYLKDEFECVSRGVIPIKGKGEMETWYLLARKSQAEMGTDPHM